MLTPVCPCLCVQVSHLRSAFYTDDFFTPLPTIDDDALPFIKIAQVSHTPQTLRGRRTWRRQEADIG